MTDTTDPAEVAIAAQEELIRELHQDFDLPMFDILAGLHGELVRQMVQAFGFTGAAKYLACSQASLARMAGEANRDPLFDLANMTPSGAA